MRLRPRHLRTRLTLWYVGMLALLLVVAWGGTCALLFLQLRNQLDHFAIQEVETVEGLFYFTPDGQLHMREDYHNHPESKEVLDRYLEVLTPDGTILLRNERLGDRTLDGKLLGDEGVGGYSPRSSQLSDGTPVRLVSRVHVLEGQPILIRLAHSEEPLLVRMKDLLLASLVVLPVVLAGAGLAGYSLARHALQPIEEMARRAQEITPERLDARLANDYSDDELRQLAGVFNDTLARLEKAFDQLRRFTADASHELRTPLAMIRSVGEVGLQKDGSRTEYRDIVGSMLEEVNRLTSLIDNLLTISRADSGYIQLHRAPLPVLNLVREAAAIFEILIEEKALLVTVEGDDRTQVEGDPVFLRQAFVNVIHNAIKYSPVGGAILARIGTGEAGQVIVEIQDNGPGIPLEDQSKVFDRFYRVDRARWRESGGAGLGLSIVKWAVEAHGGSVTLVSEPDSGCIFRIVLPSAVGRDEMNNLNDFVAPNSNIEPFHST
jgi:heavy metal sensor kinase